MTRARPDSEATRNCGPAESTGNPGLGPAGAGARPGPAAAAPGATPSQIGPASVSESLRLDSATSAKIPQAGLLHSHRSCHGPGANPRRNLNYTPDYCPEQLLTCATGSPPCAQAGLPASLSVHNSESPSSSARVQGSNVRLCIEAQGIDAHVCTVAVPISWGLSAVRSVQPIRLPSHGANGHWQPSESVVPSLSEALKRKS